MLYKNSKFTNISNILTGRVLYRATEGSPTFLLSQTDSTESEQTTVAKIKRATSETKYIPHREKEHFADSSSIATKDVFNSFLTDWEEITTQINNFATDEINSLLDKPTKHSVFTTFQYLFTLYKLNKALKIESAISGDGGVYLEFNFENKFFSIQIDSESVTKDRIYIEDGNKFGSQKLTEELIKEVFTH
jgi:hypothetical protein